MTLRNELTDHEDYINSPDGLDRYVAPAVMGDYKKCSQGAFTARLSEIKNKVSMSYKHYLPITVIGLLLTALAIYTYAGI